MGLKVLSLFDGIGTGMLALRELGFEIDEFHAFEIAPAAIKICEKNLPFVVHHGDVRECDFKEFEGFDLVMGGSPCQNRSKARIESKEVHSGIKGDKSILFWDFVRALRVGKPKWFFMENVVSALPDDDATISAELGVEPIMVDSNTVSAQDRKRLYWTNIPYVKEELPTEPCNLCIADIMEKNVDEKYFYKKPFTFLGENKKIIAELQVNTMAMSKRVYNPKFKCGTITCIGGGYNEKKVFDDGRVRKMTPLEYERLQTLPDGYTDGLGLSYTARCSACGNAWTKDVVKLFFNYIPR